MHLTDKGIMIGLGVLTVAAIGVGVYLGKKKKKEPKVDSIDQEIMKNMEIQNEFEEKLANYGKMEEKVVNTSAQPEVKQEVTKEEVQITKVDVINEIKERLKNDAEFKEMLKDILKDEVVQPVVTKPEPKIDIIQTGMTTKHVTDHKKGIEYDVNFPVDSNNDVFNVKPIGGSTSAPTESHITPASEVKSTAGMTPEEFQAKYQAEMEAKKQLIKNTLNNMPFQTQTELLMKVLHGDVLVMYEKKLELNDFPIFSKDVNSMTQDELIFFNSIASKFQPNQPQSEPKLNTASDYNAWIRQYKGGF